MASASSISRRLRSRIAGESAWPTVVIPSDAPASAAISSKIPSTPGQSSTRTLPHSRAAASDSAEQVSTPTKMRQALRLMRRATHRSNHSLANVQSLALAGRNRARSRCVRSGTVFAHPLRREAVNSPVDQRVGPHHPRKNSAPFTFGREHGAIETVESTQFLSRQSQLIGLVDSAVSDRNPAVHAPTLLRASVFDKRPTRLPPDRAYQPRNPTK